MTSEKLILEYQNSNEERKIQLISEFILIQNKIEFYFFLDCIYLDNKLSPKKYAIDILSNDLNKALSAANYLLNAKNQKDTLNSLKYYGAMIIDKVSHKVDYNETIPLLVESYDVGDYRDAKWAISMALANIINNPRKSLIKLIDSNEAIKDELLCGLESYFGTDFRLK